MKNYTFTIGGRMVTVEAVQALGPDSNPRIAARYVHGVDFTATCEGTQRTSRMSMHPKANKTIEQVEKNMADEALRLATATAGQKQSESLLGDIFNPS